MRHLLATATALGLFALPATAQIQLFPNEVYDYDLAPGITVQLTQSRFSPKGQEVTTAEQDGKRVTLIDGKRAYGNDRGQLYENLNYGVAFIQGEPVRLETTYMFNPRLGAVFEIPLKARQSKAALYIIGTFGSENHPYYAVWRIRDNKATRVLLTDDAKELKQYL